MMEEVALGPALVRYRLDGPEHAAPLLLINSLGTDHNVWRSQVGSLADDNRLIRYDARGQGGTPAPAPPYSIGALGNEAVLLLDHLEIERAHVVGISLGGLIGLWLAVNHPSRLVSGTFANTAARIGTRDAWEGRISAVRAGGMGSITALVMERYFSDHFREARPEVVRDVSSTLESHDPAGYVGYCMALRDANLRDDVADIRIPTLIVAGTLDSSTPPDEARWLANRIPAAELVLLDAGHLSNLERPAAFTGAVRAHLGRAT